MTDDVWTTGRVLSWIEGYLDERGDATPRVSAQWLVSEALGVSRMQLYLDMDRPLTADERFVLRDWTRRRGAGEPLQYITGEVGFRYITLKVAPGVLIPRPETEVLVSEALALLPAAAKPQDALDEQIIAEFEVLQRGEDPETRDAAASAAPAIETQDAIGAGERGGLEAPSERPTPLQPDAPASAQRQSAYLVADICTGSGCIACSIAHERPDVRVIATDIAPEAVALALRNVAALGLEDRVDVLEGDLAEGVQADLLGSFDLVVSNPPYIPTAELAQLESQVSDFEPRLALDGGADGLEVFRRLLDWASAALKRNGGLAVELHETCLDDAAAEAEYAGFTDVRIVGDLAGKPRVLVARKR